MALDWLDVSELSFNVLLLLERFQLEKFPGWVPQDELAIALQANPTIAWYLQHKCPEIQDWLIEVMDMTKKDAQHDAQRVRQAEEAIMREINDLLIYVVDPLLYDQQPFLAWDSKELTDLADFHGKTVIDVGSGTGRLAIAVAPMAATVFAVEPVGNLRYYIQSKAHRWGLDNVFSVDGFITALPFPDFFADVIMGGHVFGDHPQMEYQEMKRVTRPGGMIILCPGTSHSETRAHEYLLSQDFSWAQFVEPENNPVRKYWKTL
jgi:SAM-dependent methyltransferase